MINIGTPRIPKQYRQNNMFMKELKGINSVKSKSVKNKNKSQKRNNNNRNNRCRNSGKCKKRKNNSFKCIYKIS